MKKFNTTIIGYDKNEVNSFILDVTKNYEELLNRLKASDEQIKKLQEDLIKYKNLEASLERAITAANDSANQVRRATREESEQIIDTARRNASRIINDALLKAQKAENDAQVLRRRVEIYKRKVKQVIDEQREMIDEIGEIEY